MCIYSTLMLLASLTCSDKAGIAHSINLFQAYSPFHNENPAPLRFDWFRAPPVDLTSLPLTAAHPRGEAESRSMRAHATCHGIIHPSFTADNHLHLTTVYQVSKKK